MKYLSITIVSLLLLSGIHEAGQAQNRFFTKSGYIDFFSHTPIEDIRAENRQVTSFFDRETGEIVFSVLMRSFEFPKQLMQEHFNENYIESEKFPRAKFSGVINKPDQLDWNSSDTLWVSVSGELTIRDQTRPVEAKGFFLAADKGYQAGSVFSIQPTDYGIVIPKVVEGKIARVVEISVKMNYQPYQK